MMPLVVVVGIELCDIIMIMGRFFALELHPTHWCTSI